jgi:hypothetical protein
LSNSLSHRNGVAFLVVGYADGQTLHMTAQNVPPDFHLSGGLWSG